jgi:CheY-like chemotaxis protein
MAQPPLVLIVEDDHSLRDMLPELLHDMEDRTVTASDGAAGLDMLCRAAPDLVLLDVAMPIMDGLTFVRRRSEEGVPTDRAGGGHVGRHRESEARKLGAQQFVSKPLNLDVLLDVVGRCVGPPTH